MRAKAFNNCCMLSNAKIVCFVENNNFFDIFKFFLIKRNILTCTTFLSNTLIIIYLTEYYPKQLKYHHKNNFKVPTNCFKL